MKSSSLVAFRCPAHLRAEVSKAINRHNNNPGQRDALNFTSFMLRALKEKIQHLERSRKKIKRAKRTEEIVPIGKYCKLPYEKCVCDPACPRSFGRAVS